MPAMPQVPVRDGSKRSLAGQPSRRAPASIGFKDDVVIRIHADTDGGTRLDMRSQSRVGSSDIGKNAKRIRNFRRLLERQLGNA